MADNSLAVVVQRLRHLAADQREDHSDDELLQRYIESRDTLAFEVLVWRHAPVVLGVCRRLLHRDHDAEDVFQATFLTLARQTHSIRQKQALAGWLHTVACRFAKKVRSGIQASTSESLADLPARPCRDSDSRELRQVLDEEVNRLPSHYRNAFVLCYLEGLTNVEAARELGCAKGTIDSRLSWARLRLQKRLTHRGIGLSTVLAVLGTQNSSVLNAASPAIELVQQTIGHLEKIHPRLVAGRLGNPTIEMLLGESMTRTSSKWLVVTSVFAIVMALAGLNWAMSASSLPPLQQVDSKTAQASPPVDAKAPAVPATDAATTPEMAPAPKERVKTEPFSFAGSILSPDGKPVKNARVYFMTEGVLKRLDCPEGKFSFKDEPIPIHEELHVSKKVPMGHFRLVATSPEFGFIWSPQYDFIAEPYQWGSMMFTAEVYLGNGSGRSFSLRFREPSPCTGKVIDESGKPLANTIVRVQSCEFLKQENNPNSFGWVVGDPFIPNREDSAINVKTDKDGRFQLVLPKESKTTIRIERPDYAPLVGFVDNSNAEKKPATKEADDAPTSPVWVPPLELKLVKPRTIAIQVLDEVTKEPLAGIKLIAYLPPLGLSPLSEGISDAKGNLVFRLPPGRFWLWGTINEKSLRYFPSGGDLTVANEPEQKHTFFMKVGRLLKIDVVDADTGKAIPDISFRQRIFNDPINAYSLGNSSASGTLETLASLSRGKFKVETSEAIEGYTVVDAPTEWIEAKQGEPIKLRFRLRSTNRKGEVQPGSDQKDEK
jgi:RNA polymerase sigma factor (sigma-70 family)